MPAASYCVISHTERHLKGIGDPAGTPQAGITTNDLLDAERQAKNLIDGWLVGVAGSVLGAAIVAEFTAAGPTAIDPEIRDLADLWSSAIVWGWYEARNIGNTQRSDAPVSQAERLKNDAMLKARRIELAGKTIKTDGSVRRLRFGKWEQGPVAGGPLNNKTYFPTPCDLEPGDVPSEW